MKADILSPEQERIVADALRPVASELRLVDPADLIALLRYERLAELSDLVASAAELYFLPDTVRLGSGGDYRLEWRGEPQIAIDLELRLRDMTVYARLTLKDESGGIELHRIDPHGQARIDDPAMLLKGLNEARFRPAAR